jgi:hypothetical protein
MKRQHITTLATLLMSAGWVPPRLWFVAELPRPRHGRISVLMSMMISRVLHLAAMPPTRRT